MVRSKKGEQFLPEISVKELQQLYKKEKKTKSQLRLLTAILRKQGKTIDDIAFAVQKPRTTISDWLKRFEERGLAGLQDTKQPGKPTRLTKFQLKKLKSILEDSPEKQDLPFTLWTTKLIQYIIMKLFDVEYKMRNILNIVKSLGFVLKVPRQRNYKANKKAQEEFKKNLQQKYGITLNVDLRLSVLMKPTLQ